MGQCKSQATQQHIIELKNENDQIKAEIKKIKEQNQKYEQENNEMLIIESLKKENKKLITKLEEIPKLKKENEIIKNEYTIIEMQNNEYKKEKDEIKTKLKLKKTALTLVQNTWKPLTDLIDTFNKFDLDKSGIVDQNEFHKLCLEIEKQSKTARLYSIQEQHSSSTVYNNDKPGVKHNTGTIDSNQGWSALHNDINQWYQIDSIIVISVAGVVLQGRKNCNQWVKTFKISYSNEGVEWTKIDKVFSGSTDGSTKNKILFNTPINARYVRIHPVTWNNHISLRADLLWNENYKQIEEENVDTDVDEKNEMKKDESLCEFNYEEREKLFKLFDIKQNNGIDISEFLTILDREAIRNTELHPNLIIKQTMRYLLKGHIDIKEELNINILGKISKGYKYDETLNDNNKEALCGVCFYQPGMYGFSDECNHYLCFECLQESLKYIMLNGKFPAYCLGCKAEESVNNIKPNNLDLLISGSLLRYWIDTNIIDLKFAVRFYNQQKRSLQQFDFNELLKSNTIRKCPKCEFIIMISEKCNYSQCPRCRINICWLTGLVIGTQPGQCGGGHNCDIN